MDKRMRIAIGTAAALGAACALVACGSGSSGDDTLVVAGDFPLAYVKRVNTMGLNPTDGTPFAAGGDLMLREKSSASAVEHNLTSRFTQGGPAGLGVYHLITYPPQGNPTVSNTSDDNVSFGETLTLRFDQAVSITNVLFRNGDHGTSFAGNFGLSIDGGPQSLPGLVASHNTPMTATTFAFTGLGNP